MPRHVWTGTRGIAVVVVGSDVSVRCVPFRLNGAIHPLSSGRSASDTQVGGLIANQQSGGWAHTAMGSRFRWPAFLCSYDACTDAETSVYWIFGRSSRDLRHVREGSRRLFE